VQADAESTNLLEKITQVTTRVERKRAEVFSMRAKQTVEQQRIATEYTSAEADLAQAKPVLAEAEQALQLVQARDMAVIKQYKIPPPLVKLILDAVMVMQMRPGLEPVQIVCFSMFYAQAIGTH